MSQNLRHVPRKVHSALELAATMLDLPLTAQHLEALALEMAGPVRALIAEALADVRETTPVRYAVTALTGEVAVSEYAGCTTAVGLDVDLDSPAADLAARLRASQHDVTATEVRDRTTLGLTVRPQSLTCWSWWVHRLNVRVDDMRTDGDSVTATGSYRGVAINLRGEGVPDLLTDRAAARLMGLIAEPARCSA
ncbi:hypothetical protein [Streptomyces sp. NPDC020489]|uniref:hypothetical protein n=1 Tax=Streptomyces sp. NPDC020489 TaxID=3365077 RepID=UPI0037A257AE